MLIPGMLYLFINNYVPMAGIIVAFKKYNYSKGILGSDWNGLKNFRLFCLRRRMRFTITRKHSLLQSYLYIGGNGRRSGSGGPALGIESGTDA